MDIEKQLRFLKIYALLMTFACAALFGIVFYKMQHQRFSEIDVERINVRESDGKLRLVISNKMRQHRGIVDGLPLPRKGPREPGFIFFGERGDEIGGLIFESNKDLHGGSLTFDKFRGDQTVQFITDENNDGSYFAGVRMNDQNTPTQELVQKYNEIDKLPTKAAKDEAYRELRNAGKLMVERVKIGRDFDKSAIIKLRDAKGKTRIDMKVGANGEAKLNFLDDAGKVVYSLPPDLNVREKR